MINAVKVGNNWEIRKDKKTIEIFTIDPFIKWEDKLKIINEKIEKYKEVEDEILDIEKEYASFEGYKEGYYAELNCCIRIDKQEIE